MGALFGLLYCAVIVANAGLDSVLPAAMRTIRSQRSFNRFFLWHMVPTACIVYGVYSLFSYGITTMAPGHNPVIIHLLGTLFVIESGRRTMKHILSLAAYTRIVAATEIAMMAWYTATIWWHDHTTVEQIFATMRISTLAGFGVVIVTAVHWYATLPASDSTLDNKTKDDSTLDTRASIKRRAVLAGNDYVKLLFSAHSITPLVGLIGGYHTAAMVKIVGTCLYTVATILKRIAAHGFDLYYAQHGEPDIDVLLQYVSIPHRALFQYRGMFQLSMGIAAMLAVSVGWYASPCTTIGLLLCILSIVFDACIHLYERFFVNTRRLAYTIAMNSITALVACSLGLVYRHWPTPTPWCVVGILMAIACIKGVTVVAMRCLAHGCAVERCPVISKMGPKETAA